MPYSCCVDNCTSEYRNSRKNISNYRFPKDESVRQKWIEFCLNDKPFNEKTWRMCSLHFEEDCFERDLRAELLNYVPRGRKLKSGAIPTIDNPKNEQVDNIAVENVIVDDIDVGNLTEEDKAIEENTENEELRNENAALKKTVEALKRRILVKDKKIQDMKRTINCLKLCKCKSSIQIQKLKGVNHGRVNAVKLQPLQDHQYYKKIVYKGQKENRIIIRKPKVIFNYSVVALDDGDASGVNYKLIFPRLKGSAN